MNFCSSRFLEGKLALELTSCLQKHCDDSPKFVEVLQECVDNRLASTTQSSSSSKALTDSKGQTLVQWQNYFTEHDFEYLKQSPLRVQYQVVMMYASRLGIRNFSEEGFGAVVAFLALLNEMTKGEPVPNGKTLFAELQFFKNSWGRFQHKHDASSNLKKYPDAPEYLPQEIRESAYAESDVLVKAMHWERLVQFRTFMPLRKSSLLLQQDDIGRKAQPVPAQAAPAQAVEANPSSQNNLMNQFFAGMAMLQKMATHMQPDNNSDVRLRAQRAALPSGNKLAITNGEATELFALRANSFETEDSGPRISPMSSPRSSPRSPQAGEAEGEAQTQSSSSSRHVEPTGVENSGLQKGHKNLCLDNSSASKMKASDLNIPGLPSTASPEEIQMMKALAGAPKRKRLCKKTNVNPNAQEKTYKPYVVKWEADDNKVSVQTFASRHYNAAKREAAVAGLDDEEQKKKGKQAYADAKKAYRDNT